MAFSPSRDATAAAAPLGDWRKTARPIRARLLSRFPVHCCWMWPPSVSLPAT